MYANDFNDSLAINSDPHVKNSPFFPSTSTSPSWITGSIDWGPGLFNTNTSYLTDDKFSLLGSYLAKSVKVFACPAANCASPPQRAQGWTARSRSVAMSGAVGNGDKYNQPNPPFGWTRWFLAKKASDFHTPGPSDVWVFSDEHPDSIDDALLYTANYPVTSFTELPGSQHGGACGMTFADGHAIVHKWTGPIAKVPVIFKQGPPTRQQVACSINDPDMIFLAQHTPQN